MNLDGSGWLVNRSFSRSEGGAAGPERSYQISPIVRRRAARCSRAQIYDTPGFWQCMRARMFDRHGAPPVGARFEKRGSCHQWCDGTQHSSRGRVGSVPSESTQVGSAATNRAVNMVCTVVASDRDAGERFRDAEPAVEPPVAESLFRAASSSRGSMATTRLLELAVPTAGSSIVVETRR